MKNNPGCSYMQLKNGLWIGGRVFPRASFLKRPLAAVFVELHAQSTGSQCPSNSTLNLAPAANDRCLRHCSDGATWTDGKLDRLVVWFHKTGAGSCQRLSVEIGIRSEFCCQKIRREKRYMGISPLRLVFLDPASEFFPPSLSELARVLVLAVDASTLHPPSGPPSLAFAPQIQAQKRTSQLCYLDGLDFASCILCGICEYDLL